MWRGINVPRGPTRPSGLGYRVEPLLSPGGWGIPYFGSRGGRPQSQDRLLENPAAGGT
jgi:hypothetical protein